MSSKAGEISSIIKQQIQQYENRIEMKENGTVITVGDGIATVYGLRSWRKRSPSPFSATGTISMRVPKSIAAEKR